LQRKLDRTVQRGVLAERLFAEAKKGR